MIESAAIFNASILIVDDLEVNASLLARMLASAGYTRVTTTLDSFEVCELHRSNHYDLILLDLMMPGMDGFQVMEKLKEIEPDGYCPVLVVTAQPQLKLRALKAGAKDFISKPFELAEVLARVSNMLEVRLLHKKMLNYNEMLEQRVQERTARLLESESHLLTLIQTIPDLIWLKDADGVYLLCNRMFEHFFGAREADIIGKTDYDFVDREQADIFRDNDCKAMAAGKSSSNSAWVTFVDGGQRVLLDTIKTPMLAADGSLIGILGIGRDITEHQKIEEQLRHSQKMESVGTLAGGIAHDFNNILSAIMGYGAMVLETLEEGSSAKDHMREVLIAADRAADLTRRLLVFSRKQIVEVKPANVNDIVLGLQKMLARIIQESIDFSVQYADSNLIVMADAGQIEQVLINLVSNASYAMPEGGRLKISTEPGEIGAEYVASFGYGKPGRYALITVSDTGQGMDAEIREKIFEPFFTTKGIGEGTGLGLAISYSIIKQHGGYVNVYSEPGHGTVFKIYLPLSEDSPLPDKKTAAVFPVAGGDETVLVAEDDASLRQLATIVLESAGYRVITAENGEEAITKFMENREHISLVLLDMIMPKKNGKEVMETITLVNPGIKTLFSSGYTMDIVKANDLTEAGFEFINKPYQPQELLKKVREIIDR